MSLINCPVCKKEISPNAAACPHCGEPMKKDLPKPPSSRLILLLVVLVTIIAFVGNVHLVTGSNVAYSIDKRESFGFSEMFVDVDAITGMPWIAAKSRFPLGCRLLQRKRIIESEEHMRERIRANTEEAMDEARKKAVEQMKKYQVP